MTGCVPDSQGGKYYRGIGLVEVMWKVVAEILNRRLTASITFHDLLHGFRAGCGTGNATFEAKLLQQLAPLREEVMMPCTGTGDLRSWKATA